jgi:hypothetical protein
VTVLPFAQHIAEYGVSHYLKIIEGADRVCVEALEGALAWATMSKPFRGSGGIHVIGQLHNVWTLEIIV